MSQSASCIPFPVAPPSFRIEAFGLSDVGAVREKNEDCYAVLPRLGLFLVADGMGGHAGGEIAARMAIDSIRAGFEDNDTTLPFGTTRTSRLSGPSRLVEAIEFANARIFAAAERERALRGMGTTVVGAFIWGDRLGVAFHAMSPEDLAASLADVNDLNAALDRLFADATARAGAANRTAVLLRWPR